MAQFQKALDASHQLSLCKSSLPMHLCVFILLALFVRHVLHLLTKNLCDCLFFFLQLSLVFINCKCKIFYIVNPLEITLDKALVFKSQMAWCDLRSRQPTRNRPGYSFKILITEVNNLTDSVKSFTLSLHFN